MTSDLLRQTYTRTPNIVGLHYKTVGFFLSKEIGKAWRIGLTREAREPHTPARRTCEAREKKSSSLFSASFQTFCLTARAYLNTQKYGLFCSLLLGQQCWELKKEFDRLQTLRIAERLCRMHYQ